MPRKDGFELAGLRNPVGGVSGKAYWRSLDELAQTEEFQQALWREFPEQASQWNDQTTRRQFLTLMGASLALAGLNGCARRPEEKIVPYVEQPEQIVPGMPMYFASVLSLAGDAVGVLVESHMGRPTKIEGNPRHPAVPAADWGGDELLRPGATNIYAQAAILGLYDPDRSQVVTNLGEISSWAALLSVLDARLQLLRSAQGAGLRILTETVTSPTLASQLQTLLEQFPEARWHQYEPVHRDNARAGAQMAFGEDVNPIYQFDRADVILALDADFLSAGPGHLRYSRDFISGRRVRQQQAGTAEMNRLYVIECTPTITGAMADHRLALTSRQVEAATREIARRLGIDAGPASGSDLAGIPATWLDALVDDLQNYRRRSDPGSALVLAGIGQPPAVHALVHAINETLGAVGKTVNYTEPIEANPVSQTESLSELVDDMRAGRVEMLIILGGNPVFNAPVDLQFPEALAKVPFSLHTSLYQDETSVLCQWHVPQCHPLESWGDVRAFDGTAAIAQPMIDPLYNGRSPHELLAAMLGQSGQTAMDVVRRYWQQQYTGSNFEHFWQQALHDGVVPDTELPLKNVSLQADFLAGEQASSTARSGADSSGGDLLEIVFRPDPAIWDGRFANNGWLQELPKPFTKLTWDNAALISPATAKQFALTSGDMIALDYAERTLRIPVWVLPGHPDRSVTLHFGHGRTSAGLVGTATGFNVYSIRTSDSPWFGSAASLQRTGDRFPLATTQHHWLIDGRGLIHSGTLEQYREHPEHPEFMESEHGHGEHVSLLPEWEYKGYKWGMAIDLNACTGCNACMVACQAENNVPVVGKQQVLVGREMHWLRIDCYYAGDVEQNPETFHQPVPCMHCEHAPCELVCPVAATVHGDEGLNEMVYNRCVGTRYCANNCPYKVRRFNFLGYSDYATPALKLLHNPNVTVRSRGVMEKCTYCVQRISASRIRAEKENRQIRDGEVVTACQAACPTQAIIFGDLNDSSSKVKALKEEPLNYGLLAELNTRPRTTYLASLRNPNPALQETMTK